MSKQHHFACENISPVAVEKPRGGTGTLFQRSMVEEAAKGSALRSMSVSTLPPGTSIGIHVHDCNEEIYVILAGEALYTSEEGEHTLKAGDVAVCYKGEKHGLCNNGTVDCIMAGILIQQ